MRISDWSSDVCSSDLFEPQMATFSPGRKCSARKDANLRLSASNSAYVHCSPLSPAIAGTLSATWSGACSAACSSNCPTVQSRRGRCSSAATKAKPAPSETISHLSRQGSATEARPPMILSLKAHLLFRLKKVSYITICVNPPTGEEEKHGLRL